MSSIIGPYPSDSRNHHLPLIPRPPDLYSSTFAVVPRLDILHQTSETDLHAGFVNLLKSVGCSNALTVLPTLSPESRRSLIARLSSTQVVEIHSPTIVPAPRQMPTPLSPKRFPKVNLLADLADIIDTTPAPSTSPTIAPRPRASLEHSPYSDDENGEEGSSFSLSRPQLVAVDTNDATLIPTQPCIALDPTAQRALDRHASSEAAIRIRIASDFAYIQSLTPLSHAATAETNITGSSVPDIDILCDTLTLTDLVRIHTHAVLNLWAMFYIMACVTHECSPSQFNTSRLRSICADVPSIDRHIARRIQDHAVVPHTLSASAQSPTNPAAIALAYPFLASNTLAIVAECVTFDYDPITPLAHAIQNLHFHTNTNGLVFDGLSTLLAATDSIAKLPRHTIATLNLRENYKSIILLLVPLRQYDFRCTHRQTSLALLYHVCHQKGPSPEALAKQA